MHATARIDGAGNSRPEDVTWRRYTDVLSVARRHLRSEGVAGWLRAERTRLRHKGHYVPLFLDFAAQALSARDLSRAARCCWLAWRASPPHLAASLARSAGRGLLRERG
jgi:hypothetical protein